MADNEPGDSNPRSLLQRGGLASVLRGDNPGPGGNPVQKGHPENLGLSEDFVRHDDAQPSLLSCLLGMDSGIRPIMAEKGRPRNLGEAPLFQINYSVERVFNLVLRRNK